MQTPIMTYIPPQDHPDCEQEIWWGEDHSKTLGSRMKVLKFDEGYTKKHKKGIVQSHLRNVHRERAEPENFVNDIIEKILKMEESLLATRGSGFASASSRTTSHCFPIGIRYLNWLTTVRHLTSPKPSPLTRPHPARQTRNLSIIVIRNAPKQNVRN